MGTYSNGDFHNRIFPSFCQQTWVNDRQTWLLLSSCRRGRRRVFLVETFAAAAGASACVLAKGLCNIYI